MGANDRLRMIGKVEVSSHIEDQGQDARSPKEYPGGSRKERREGKKAEEKTAVEASGGEAGADGSQRRKRKVVRL